MTEVNQCLKQIEESKHAAHFVPVNGPVSASAAGSELATVEPMQSKPILLWAPPRSTSTAFERAVMQHPDVTVFHEQLADCFYFGPDRLEKELPPAIAEWSGLKRNSSYSEQLRPIEEAVLSYGKPFSFSKELSIYYQEDRMSTKLMSRFTHCFLIRQPEKVVRSFLRVAANAEDSSTYFDPDECGFLELEKIYDAVVTAGLQESIFVLDSDSLLANPEGALRAFCAAVDLPFDPRMAAWKPEEPSSWAKWPGWHNDAANSTGFKAKRYADEETPLPEDAQRAVDLCQPIYDKFFQMCPPLPMHK